VAASAPGPASRAFTVAAVARSWVLAASALAGLGQGLAFGGALAQVNTAAPDRQRGEVLSAFYVVIYLGTAPPVIGTGVVAVAVGLLPAVQVFAGCAITGCLAGLVLLRGQGHQLGQAREHGPTRPHPHAPASPEVLKMAGPAVAAVDKLRDAVTGRGRNA
jgi:MFS family permease